MGIVRTVPNAYKLESIITDDLLLARDITCGLPVSAALTEAQTHLGSIVHGFPLRPGRPISDRKSVIIIADALHEAAEHLSAYERVHPLWVLFPAIEEEERGRREQTFGEFVDKLRGHVRTLNKLLEPHYRIKLAPFKAKAGQLTA
ncbi:MAG: hypothetical protein PHY92_05980 [Alphaproteobacteria bacterium]|nr:hypothetical protein [Alphaproteobacteria bacterium]